MERSGSYTVTFEKDNGYDGNLKAGVGYTVEDSESITAILWNGIAFSIISQDSGNNLDLLTYWWSFHMQFKPNDMVSDLVLHSTLKKCNVIQKISYAFVLEKRNSL